MPVINVSFQVIPKVSNQDTYQVVDKAIEVVANSGVKYEVGPMETTMEGELDHLLEIVKAAQQACVEAGAERVMTIIKIDYHPQGVTMEEKIGKYRGRAD
ncbi:MAG: MTH1187 family thiamine-binding protein [Carboxydocellales bacterium]